MYNKKMLQDRAAAMKRFNKWEKTYPSHMAAQKALAAIGTIYDLIPPESRKTCCNPANIQAMQSALCHIRANG